MLLSALNCDPCRGLWLTFNYVTGAALSEAASGYPSSQGSYSVEGGKLSNALLLPYGRRGLKIYRSDRWKEPANPRRNYFFFLLKLLIPKQAP